MYFKIALKENLNTLSQRKIILKVILKKLKEYRANLPAENIEYQL
jgi:hypothetical protein